MPAKIVCKKIDFNTQALYVDVKGVEHFLLQRSYKNECREFFKQGYYLTDNINYSKLHNSAFKKMLDKIPSYIKYLENILGVPLYEKTKQKNNRITRKKKIKEINYYSKQECFDYINGY